MVVITLALLSQVAAAQSKSTIDVSETIFSVLSADGVPTSKAPSLPTEATTFPALVANTNTFGVISVTPTLS